MWDVEVQVEVGIGIGGLRGVCGNVDADEDYEDYEDVR